MHTRCEDAALFPTWKFQVQLWFCSSIVYIFVCLLSRVVNAASAKCKYFVIDDAFDPTRAAPLSRSIRSKTHKSFKGGLMCTPIRLQGNFECEKFRLIEIVCFEFFNSQFSISAFVMSPEWTQPCDRRARRTESRALNAWKGSHFSYALGLSVCFVRAIWNIFLLRRPAAQSPYLISSSKKRLILNISSLIGVWHRLSIFSLHARRASTYHWLPDFSSRCRASRFLPSAPRIFF